MYGTPCITNSGRCQRDQVSSSSIRAWLSCIVHLPSSSPCQLLCCYQLQTRRLHKGHIAEQGPSRSSVFDMPMLNLHLQPRQCCCTCCGLNCCIVHIGSDLQQQKSTRVCSLVQKGKRGVPRKVACMILMRFRWRPSIRLATVHNSNKATKLPIAMETGLVKRIKMIMS